MSSGITVLIPCYQAAHFLDSTLDCLMAQTLPAERVILVDDASQDSTWTRAQLWAERWPSLTVRRNDDRLGWRANTNRLLDQVATPYACILPHDDLLAPTYLERLRAALVHHSHAVAAYSDLIGFGTRRWVGISDSVTGNQAARLVRLLAEPFPAIAFRGLLDCARLRHRTIPRLMEGGADYAKDAVWVFALGLIGPLVRVPETLYAKRYHSANSHDQWGAGASPEERLELWTDHCIDMVRTAYGAQLEASTRALVAPAADLRWRSGGKLIGMAERTALPAAVNEAAWLRLRAELDPP